MSGQIKWREKFPPGKPVSVVVDGAAFEFVVVGLTKRGLALRRPPEKEKSTCLNGGSLSGH